MIYSDATVRATDPLYSHKAPVERRGQVTLDPTWVTVANHNGTLVLPAHRVVDIVVHPEKLEPKTDTEREPETDGETLARLGTDGAAWAAELSDKLDTHGIVLNPVPGGLLHGWFANAIEAGRLAGYSDALREYLRARTLDDLPRWDAAAMMFQKKVDAQ